MSIKLIFDWRDLWIGVFWDTKKRRLYILPLPMVGIVISFGDRLPSFGDDPDCPGEDCPMCKGEVCRWCGPITFGMPLCTHDGCDRHAPYGGWPE